jgi:hypothetical protein
MMDVGGDEVQLEDPVTSPDSKFLDASQEVASLLIRMNALLVELDSHDLPRAAAYLSMAIDQVESDFATKSN